MIVLAFLLPGCNWKPRPPLRVGASVWPGFECLFLARNLGLYENSPLQLVEYPSTPEVIRSFQNGAIEAAAMSGDEFLRLAEHNPDVRAVLVLDYSMGADALMARPDIDHLAGLRGRRVGVEANTLGAYLLNRALDRAGLAVSDIVVTPVPSHDHLAAFSAGKIDAVVTFEPYRSRLLAAGARVLFDSSDTPGEVLDLLIVRKEVVDERLALLQRLVDGWFEAREHLLRNPQAAAEKMARREETSPEAFLESLKGLQIPSREQNQSVFGRSNGQIVPVLSRLNALMLTNGLMRKMLEIPALLDGRLVLDRP